MLTGLNNRHGLSYISVSHEQNFPWLFTYDPEAPTLSDSSKCWRNLAKSFPVENLSAVAACFIIGSKSLRYRFHSIQGLGLLPCCSFPFTFIQCTDVEQSLHLAVPFRRTLHELLCRL